MCPSRVRGGRDVNGPFYERDNYNVIGNDTAAYGYRVSDDRRNAPRCNAPAARRQNAMSRCVVFCAALRVERRYFRAHVPAIFRREGFVLLVVVRTPRPAYLTETALQTPPPPQTYTALIPGTSKTRV